MNWLQYKRNWRLYVRGFRWLWTRDMTTVSKPSVVNAIRYQRGWSPARFLPLYCTTYLLGVACGFGVVSMSRVWYERSRVANRYPFSHWITRKLDDWFPGKLHGAFTGPWLWGSRPARGVSTLYDDTSRRTSDGSTSRASKTGRHN